MTKGGKTNANFIYIVALQYDEDKKIYYVTYVCQNHYVTYVCQNHYVAYVCQNHYVTYVCQNHELCNYNRCIFPFAPSCLVYLCDFDTFVQSQKNWRLTKFIEKLSTSIIPK
jgi:hypothetical protein